MAKRRTKQSEIPGSRPEAIPEIDDQAEVMGKARTKRISEQSKETGAETRICELAVEHGLVKPGGEYFYPLASGKRIRIAPKQVVKMGAKIVDAAKDDEQQGRLKDVD